MNFQEQKKTWRDLLIDRLADELFPTEAFEDCGKAEEL